MGFFFTAQQTGATHILLIALFFLILTYHRILARKMCIRHARANLNYF